jgi:hypothetical protein
MEQLANRHDLPKLVKALDSSLGLSDLHRNACSALSVLSSPTTRSYGSA